MSNNPNTTQKIFSSRLNNQPASTYVGESGRIFYHEDTGELRLSDGVTPGGLPIAGGSGSSSIQLIGDVTASGTTGANTTVTLNTVNADVGIFGSATSIPVFTVNAKGLITSASNVSVSIPSGNITLIGDATGSGVTGGNTIVTFNTVNSNVGTFGDAADIPIITVNSKGLITSVSTAQNIPLQLVLGNPLGNLDVMYFTGLNKVPDFVVDNTGDLVYA